jgi:hypothetical protein
LPNRERLAFKVSDEFTVPLCRGHHRQVHQTGDEKAWWENLRINALEIARGLWEQSHTASAVSESVCRHKANVIGTGECPLLAQSRHS